MLELCWLSDERVETAVRGVRRNDEEFLMTRKCERKPELRPVVESLIDRMTQVHESGAGTLQLSNMVELFGELTDENKQTIKKRGDVELIRSDELSGRFINRGDALKLKISLLSVRVPEEIGGTYFVYPDKSVRFSYDESGTIAVSVDVGFLSLKTDLEDLTISNARIDIDVSGLAPDKCFLLV